MVFECLVAGGGLRVAPGHRSVAPIADEGVEVAGHAFELAVRGALSAWHQEFYPHVIPREVDRRRVARLEYA